ncbi:hypothetical protein HSX10_06605 [Winogradskyella undariae]|uniref:hypothetical protein n=1 Tax=Winogradskyella TaxID=286104 RepID=UPI00156B9E4F|nr:MULTISPECIES: hypothetical protein [Winogradskyella]NRR91231.1 hypothetical protein [Winogradskyella undariae]QXP80416.1 hypothetical protein H0I32_07275 [Winogradskyella sp. HaHa_3_26]
MPKASKHIITAFLFILFVALISAPSVIMSVDDSIDTTCFFSISEEEDNHSVKILFDKNHQTSECVFENNTDKHLVGYTFGHYPKPHFNLISPPPDSIS